MKINFYHESDHQKFIDFNATAFPERGQLGKKLTNFRYFNPLHSGNFAQDNILSFDDSGEISGQALYHPAKYNFENETRAMEWGFDLFVRPDMRSESVGLHLMEYIKAQKHTPIFASGVGEKALKIEKFFGYHVIGYLKKYYKIANPFFLITGLLAPKNIKPSQFPKAVVVGNKRFERTTFENLWNVSEPYNNNLLEFARDREFLQWRYYSEGFGYAVYRFVGDSPQKPLYFVVRTVKIKKITTLVLVDYRYDTSKKEQLELILDAVAKVCGRLFLPIIVTGSSHQITDDVMESKKFKVTGKDRPIICNKKEYKQFKEAIANRNFIFSTLADSDGEYLM